MIDEQMEQDVIRMSHDIDNFFEQYLIENENVPLLHFFSIVLARMTAISQATNSTSIFKRLLEEVLKIMEAKELDNGNYH